MSKNKEKRSGKDRREKDNPNSESYIKYFVPEKEESRVKDDRRKAPKSDPKKKTGK